MCKQATATTQNHNIIKILPAPVAQWRKSLHCSALGLCGRQAAEVRSSTPCHGGLSVQASKQTSLFAQLINKDIYNINE